MKLNLSVSLLLGLLNKLLDFTLTSWIPIWGDREGVGGCPCYTWAGAGCTPVLEAHPGTYSGVGM